MACSGTSHLEVRVLPGLRQQAVVEERHAVRVVPRLALAFVLHDGVELNVLHHLHLGRLVGKKKQERERKKQQKQRESTTTMISPIRETHRNGTPSAVGGMKAACMQSQKNPGRDDHVMLPRPCWRRFCLAYKPNENEERK